MLSVTKGGAMDDTSKSLKPSKRSAKSSGDRNGYTRYPIPPETIPNIDDLVIEDNEPVESFFVEKQYRLLTDPLHASWKPEGRSFLAVSNVGLFYADKIPPLVPDVMLSLDVPVGRSPKQKENNSYFTWIIGKPPDVVIEIVSDRRGGEEDFKKDEYAKIGVRYYVIFDPDDLLRGGVLRAFDLVRGDYRPRKASWLPRVGLGLRLWQGEFQGMPGPWLRWCDRAGVVIPTGGERAEQEHERAEQARQSVKQMRQRAKEERERAERLAAQLRALGSDPEV
jgi:Uma2 family endonuclease